MALTMVPTRIRHLNHEMQSIFALLAGMQLDLFSPLHDGPLSADQLADAINVDAEKLGLLLYALVAAEMLTVDDGRFSNTNEADAFLVSSNPNYLGGVQSVWIEMLESGVKAAESVRTGVPQAHADYASMEPDRLFGILGGLHSQSLHSGRILAERYDFGEYAHVLDVGGGSGGMSIGLVEAYPELRVTVADLPYVVPMTQRFITDVGLDDRINAVPSDVLEDVLEGSFDAIVTRFFLQILSSDQIPVALRNMATALRPGGTLYTINFMLEDNRLTPTFSNLMNVQFLSHYHRGQSYTEGEYRGWLSDAGFIDISRSEDVVGIPLLVARKAR